MLYCIMLGDSSKIISANVTRNSGSDRDPQINTHQPNPTTINNNTIRTTVSAGIAVSAPNNTNSKRQSHFVTPTQLQLPVKTATHHRTKQLSGNLETPWVGRNNYKAATHKLELNRTFKCALPPKPEF